MQPNEKTNDKENLQANQQPKKTWQEPVMTTLILKGGIYQYSYEYDLYNVGPDGSQPFPY
jgi:hypothetical protein